MSNVASVAVIVAVIGGQLAAIWYIANTLGSRITDLGTVVGRLDTRLSGTLEAFRQENHADMQAHTEAITDLRERVAKLEA